MIKDLEKFVLLYNDRKKYPTVKQIAAEFGVTDRSVRRTADKCRASGIKLVNRNLPYHTSHMTIPLTEMESHKEELIEETVTDEEILVENIKIAKALQRVQDKSRIEKKSFRDYARSENALIELDTEILAELKRLNVSKLAKQHKTSKQQKSYGIFHISDVHLNELVNVANNRYDWNIAAQRLKKHVESAKLIFGAYGIKEVLVAFTGDILNSDRRLDEILGNAGNRAKACVLAVLLYKQALLDLNQDFNLLVATVSGNESRIPKDIGWVPAVSSDNYDFIIGEHLRIILESPGIQFVPPSADPGEVVVKLGEQKVLLIHSHGSLEHKAPDRSVLQLKGRYQARGIDVDLVIFGHVHSCLISDLYARSSSMVGTNDYAEKALGLAGRASQNLYIIQGNNGWNGVKIDLQNTDGIEGYDIVETLVAYNTKSALKAHKEIVIHEMK